MTMTDPMIEELAGESQATRRLLERVPEDRLDWKPHEKSMSLGELARHIATLPAMIAEALVRDEMEAPDDYEQPAPESVEEILTDFEEGLTAARETLAGMDDEAARETWRLVRDGEELMSMPRLVVARTVLLNHLYHHRGQLTVYLRLLDVPLPATYAASADESLFDG